MGVLHSLLLWESLVHLTITRLPVMRCVLACWLLCLRVWWLVQGVCCRPLPWEVQNRQLVLPCVSPLVFVHAPPPTLLLLRCKVW